MAATYGQDPRVVAEWKGPDLVLWHNEAVKLDERRMKMMGQMGCAWR